MEPTEDVADRVGDCIASVGVPVDVPDLNVVGPDEARGEVGVPQLDDVPLAMVHPGVVEAGLHRAENHQPTCEDYQQQASHGVGIGHGCSCGAASELASPWCGLVCGWTGSGR